MSEEIIEEKRKPGRPPKKTVDDQVSDARARRERRRGQIGSGNFKLTAPQRSGFVRRWVNDVVGRVDQFRENGWDVVQEDGTDSRHVGGQKNPLKAVLMEIPEQFYQEDQQTKLSKVVDPRQMKENQAKAATSDSPEEYIPGRKDSAVAFDKLR